jgi:CO/xanthine dehydrogenase Mo-binding subunit
MQESMMDALAKALGLSPEELDNRLEAGRSLASIAEEQGQSVEQLRSAWSDAWQEALDAAVKEGQLTQEEADWMRDHMSSPQLEARPLWGDGRPGMFPRTGRGPGSEMPQWDSD